MSYYPHLNLKLTSESFALLEILKYFFALSQINFCTLTAKQRYAKNFLLKVADKIVLKSVSFIVVPSLRYQRKKESFQGVS